MARLGRGRLTLIVSAAVMIIIMLGAVVAALFTGLLGGGGPAGSGPGCGDWLASNFSVSLVAGEPGVVAFLEAAETAGGVAVRISFLNNGTSIVDLEWLREAGVRVELYDAYGVRLGATAVNFNDTLLTPGQYVSRTVTFRLEGGLAEPAYVLAGQSQVPLFLTQWLLDPRAEAGGCGYRVANYTWGQAAFRWIALQKGLIVVEAVAVLAGGQHEIAQDGEGPYMTFTVYDEAGAPLLKIKSPKIAEGPLRVPGGKTLVILAAASSQLDKPESIEVESRLAVDGMPVEGFKAPFSEAPWPEDFPGSWLRGTIEVPGDGVTALILYSYNGYIFVVKNATIVADGEAVVKVPPDFRNTPFIGMPPTPGAIVEVKAGGSTVAVARFFSPQYRGESLTFNGTVTEDNTTYNVYIVNGTLQLVALTQLGVKPFAVLAAPYGFADTVIVRTPWGEASLSLTRLASGSQG